MSNVAFKRICVLGLGYIGLPTAAIFASRKIEVIGIDVNPVVVSSVNAGRIHIVEPNLDGIVFDAVNDGYLRASLEPEPADVFIIAVPTPFKGAAIAMITAGLMSLAFMGFTGLVKL